MWYSLADGAMAWMQKAGLMAELTPQQVNEATAMAAICRTSDYADC